MNFNINQQLRLLRLMVERGVDLSQANEVLCTSLRPPALSLQTILILLSHSACPLAPVRRDTPSLCVSHWNHGSRRVPATKQRRRQLRHSVRCGDALVSSRLVFAIVLIHSPMCAPVLEKPASTTPSAGTSVKVCVRQREGRSIAYRRSYCCCFSRSDPDLVSIRNRSEPPHIGWHDGKRLRKRYARHRYVRAANRYANDTTSAFSLSHARAARYASTLLTCLLSRVALRKNTRRNATQRTTDPIPGAC